MTRNIYRKLCALVVDDDLREPTAAGRATSELIADLERQDVEVFTSTTAADATTVIASNPHVHALIINWDLHRDPRHAKAVAVILALRSRRARVPVFLLAERTSAACIPADIMAQIDDFIWILEDTASFIGGRILVAMDRYRKQLLPPMFSALTKFARTHEYSWHTPGHTGGTAFLKSPVGREFFDFFGESLFRSDLSISVGDLGSLLDHSGPIGEGERYAARVFGADRTYYVTNGTSTSNRVVFSASVARGQIVLCDRNCHKSTEHAITLTGGIPVYMMPQRNHLGLIGPIPPSAMSPEAIQRSISNSPLAAASQDRKAVHAVITNSTYDGLCYNAERVEELLGQSVDRLHFDEAWYGYARFHPLYRGRFAMRDSLTRSGEGPTVFATQSTHKLLAALSQASMIHVRDGRHAIDHERFNEAFMMHASTSPQYAIIASNDVSAAMMDGTGGRLLTNEAIAEAVAFRQMIARIHAEFALRDEWFFNAWQPDSIRDRSGGANLAFAAAPEALLVEDPSCWILDPLATWHGFQNLEDEYCMLDPIKVSIVTPGVEPSGQLSPRGIPAPLLTAYLAAHGIVAEKTANFTVLFLFSIGVTKGKWGSLVSALLEFKRDYDNNVPLDNAIPLLVEKNPGRYAKMGLKDLAQDMFQSLKELNTLNLLERAFETLPIPALTPADAYEQLVRGNCRSIPLSALEDASIATAIVPYPPGIPLLMPGERIGGAHDPNLAYLRALERFDALFPGFAHDIHGIEIRDSRYYATLIDKC